MHPTSLHYFPLSAPFLLVLLIVLGVVFAVIQVGALSYAYERMGIRRHHIFGLLVLSFLGSYVNIPIAELFSEQLLPGGVVSAGGMTYVIPNSVIPERTIVAINVGGAVVPLLLSLYLLAKNRLFGRGLLGTAIVAAVVYHLAHPVRGVGITVPTFVPPLVTAVVALALSRRYAAPLAYSAGSLGTLIGADVLNLGRIPGLGAPVASIGGAGTFDGVFLTGILAVLLASLYRGGKTARSKPESDSDEPQSDGRSDPDPGTTPRTARGALLEYPHAKGMVDADKEGR